MFSADTKLDVAPRLAPAHGRNSNQFADTVPVNCLERVVLQNTATLIVVQEGSTVVPAQAERRLCQIVGTKGEEFR